MKHIKLFESWAYDVINEGKSKEDILSILSSKVNSLEDFYQAHEEFFRDIVELNKDADFLNQLKSLISRLPGNYPQYRKEKEKEKLINQSNIDAQRKNAIKGYGEDKIKSSNYDVVIKTTKELAKNLYDFSSLKPEFQEKINLSSILGGKENLYDIRNILYKITGNPSPTLEPEGYFSNPNNDKRQQAQAESYYANTYTYKIKKSLKKLNMQISQLNNTRYPDEFFDELNKLSIRPYEFDFIKKLAQIPVKV